MASKRSVFWGIVRDWGLALGITLLVLAGWNLLNRIPSLPSGEAAPDFTLETLEGDTFSLASKKGEVVVINFWATWCGPCRTEIPELAEFHTSHPDIELVGVSVDHRLSTTELAGWVDRSRINYPVVHDPKSEVAGRYGVQGYPTTVVVGEDGTVRTVKVGAVSRSQLERMLAEAQGSEM